MRRDMRGRINHVPRNVYKEGRSSAKLEGERGREREGESSDMGTVMDEFGVDLLLCLPTLYSTLIQLRLVLN